MAFTTTLPHNSTVKIFKIRKVQKNKVLHTTIFLYAIKTKTPQSVFCTIWPLRRPTFQKRPLTVPQGKLYRVVFTLIQKTEFLFALYNETSLKIVSCLVLRTNLSWRINICVSFQLRRRKVKTRNARGSRRVRRSDDIFFGYCRFYYDICTFDTFSGKRPITSHKLKPSSYVTSNSLSIK